MLGHVLNAGLTIALAAAAAMVADHPSTAAILTLSVTVGTWVLAFVAAVQGGVWEIAARYTPAAMVADFQHGLLRVDALLVSLALIALGLALASVWTRTGVPVRRRWVESSLAGLVAAVLIAAGARTRGSWDLSESRMNSFAAADEQALRQITSPLRIEAHLAPEDPRRSDLERQALGKLRRLLPQLDVVYVAESGTGLFEQSDEHYGEIRYTLDGRTATSRATTVEGVLDTLYELSGVRLQAAGIEVFRGHPMTTAPRGVGWMFYGMWPAVAAAVALARGRRQS
jgi:hypothetical protein